MRIRIYASPDIKKEHPFCDFINMINRRIAMTNGYVVTEEQPDIVHIIGCWDQEAFRITKKMCNMRIPYVYSTMEGLLPWNREKWSDNILFYSHQKKAISHAALILAGGELEKNSLEELKWNKHITTITNPLTTNSVTEENTIQLLLSYYEHVKKEHEKTIRCEIEQNVKSMPLDNDDARKVMRMFMYASYLCRRKMIPQNFLDEFSQILTTTDYDENLMENMLCKNNLIMMAARIEQVMADESTLTEGFMPVTARDDKETDKIKNYITRYQRS